MGLHLAQAIYTFLSKKKKNLENCYPPRILPVGTVYTCFSWNNALSNCIKLNAQSTTMV